MLSHECGGLHPSAYCFSLCLLTYASATLAISGSGAVLGTFPSSDLRVGSCSCVHAVGFYGHCGGEVLWTPTYDGGLRMRQGTNFDLAGVSSLETKRIHTHSSRLVSSGLFIAYHNANGICGHTDESRTGCCFCYTVRGWQSYGAQRETGISLGSASSLDSERPFDPRYDRGVYTRRRPKNTPICGDRFRDRGRPTGQLRFTGLVSSASGRPRQWLVLLPLPSFV